MFSECNAVWPRRPERRELSVIKIRSSMPPAAYQRLDANPTIHMPMRFLGSTVSYLDLYRGCSTLIFSTEMLNLANHNQQDQTCTGSRCLSVGRLLMDFPAFCSAIRKSWSVCKFSQNSGLVPKK